MKRIIIDNIETKYLISENGEGFSEYKNIFLKSSTTQHGYTFEYLEKGSTVIS